MKCLSIAYEIIPSKIKNLKKKVGGHFKNKSKNIHGKLVEKIGDLHSRQPKLDCMQCENKTVLIAFGLHMVQFRRQNNFILIFHTCENMRFECLKCFSRFSLEYCEYRKFTSVPLLPTLLLHSFVGWAYAFTQQNTEKKKLTTPKWLVFTLTKVN